MVTWSRQITAESEVRSWALLEFSSFVLESEKVTAAFRNILCVLFVCLFGRRRRRKVATATTHRWADRKWWIENTLRSQTALYFGFYQSPVVAFTRAFSRQWNDQHQLQLHWPSSTTVILTATNRRGLFLHLCTNKQQQKQELQDTLRKTAWPEDLPLTEKLYGDPASLRRTASCPRGASVSV